MTTRTITSSKEKGFNDIWGLYEKSFPKIERRKYKDQIKIFNNSSYHLDAYYQESRLIGFISYWEFETYIYLEHFAINELLRGRGYGKRLLRELISNTEKIIVLEIEPIVDEVSQNRKNFYESLGFIMNSFKYKVQSYQNKAVLYDLEIMSYPRIITQDELDTFRYDFVNIIL